MGCGLAGGEGEAASKPLWVQCNACDKWRILNQEVYNQTVAPHVGEGKQLFWVCAQNWARAGASCADPSDRA